MEASTPLPFAIVQQRDRYSRASLSRLVVLVAPLSSGDGRLLKFFMAISVICRAGKLDKQRWRKVTGDLPGSTSRVETHSRLEVGSGTE